MLRGTSLKKRLHFVTVLGEVVGFSLVIEAANRQ